MPRLGTPKKLLSQAPFAFQ